MAGLSASVAVWRSLSIFLLLVILLQFYWILSSDRSATSLSGYRAPTFLPPPPPPAVQEDDDTWSFDFERDGSNTGLKAAQCEYAFPNLYYEINRSVQYWQDRGRNITQEDADISWRADAALRLMIYDNQLRILEYKKAWNRNPYRIRVTYTILGIYRALLGATAAGEKLPNIEFSIVVDDMTLMPGDEDTHSTWGYCRPVNGKAQEKVWMMPDFGFYASPPVATSYTEMQQRAKEHDMRIADKIPKIVWRGALGTNRYVREHLVNVTADLSWADVKAIRWTDEHADLIAMEDLCRYRYVAHTEGRSWSGRLKFLLNCDSIPVIHDLDWTSSYYHLLKPDGPDQNHINVKRDWSDLEEKITWFTHHPEEAQRVADNSVRTFRERYTSLAAEACYWRKLVHGWSQVAFEPEPFETVTVEIDGTPVKKQQLRGTAFEEFIYIPNENMGG